jgi:hypothetical protein
LSHSTREHHVDHRFGAIILDCHNCTGYKSTVRSSDSIDDFNDINQQSSCQAAFESGTQIRDMADSPKAASLGGSSTNIC